MVAQVLRDNFGDDPVLERINLVGAESHGGLQFVRLYYYAPDRATAERRLGEVKDMIRFELAAIMNQRYVPDLGFTYDDTLEKSARIDALLAGI